MIKLAFKIDKLKKRKRNIWLALVYTLVFSDTMPFKIAVTFDDHFMMFTIYHFCVLFFPS